MTEEEKILHKKRIKSECDKRYREKNKELLAQKKSEYYYKNKEKLKNDERRKMACKKHYEKNKEKINSKRSQKRWDNIELTRQKERKRKENYKKNPINRKKWLDNNKNYIKSKLQNDVSYKLKHCYRNALGKIKRKKGFTKRSKTCEYLGCDWETFKCYIESLFESWMTWDNWGVYDPKGERTWQIDHIKPLSHFDFNEQEEIKKAFHYTNCRPYCSKKNITEQHYR